MTVIDSSAKQLVTLDGQTSGRMEYETDHFVPNTCIQQVRGKSTKQTCLIGFYPSSERSFICIV